MIAKLGFVFILAVFGVLMFVGGVLAPSSLRQSVAVFEKQANQKLNAMFGKAASASSAASAPGASASAAASAPAAAKADPIPAESLLLPTPLPDNAQYAVQAGWFADAGQANALGKRIKELKLPFDKVLDVVDQAGQRWSVVPVGPYATADEARTARAGIARDLSLNDSLPLILLPAPKPKS
jgi:cell division septation protein DedD